jgi:hypothetical protein
MATQQTRIPIPNRPLGSPYCCDPTCKSCNELQDAYARVGIDRAQMCRSA